MGLSPLSHVTLTTDNFLPIQNGENVDFSLNAPRERKRLHSNVPPPWRRPTEQQQPDEPSLPPLPPSENTRQNVFPPATRPSVASSASSHMTVTGPPIYDETDSDVESDHRPSIAITRKASSKGRSDPSKRGHSRTETWSRPRATSIGDGAPRPPGSRSPLLGSLIGAVAVLGWRVFSATFSLFLSSCKDP